ncbi:MAG: tRNA (adenosine(37)-N6)-dimethylallyltransferase MiaA [Marinicaulis sp.]|nr:tRNA (adenosine(37)-N6)-dimethylallyltransferase MiaA [Marinicaulis sp.]
MPDKKNNKIIFIAGPTASGKSGLALKLAHEIGGEIVNADAMQVYRDLLIVTARPSVADEAAVPHHLYGVLDGADACSAARWAKMAAGAISEIKARNVPAILVGGTGLYFKALDEGLSPVPDIQPETRAKAAARRKEIGASAFYQEVITRDPAMAHLPVNDAQRLIRAWEVYEETGRPLSEFQSLPREPLIDSQKKKFLLLPPRDELYSRCDSRAAQMLSGGAIDEVKALLARDLDPGLPIMKALGVSEIAALLRGETGERTALQHLQQSTRRFAKRQMTWFRNQCSDWSVIEGVEQALR